MGLVRPFIAAGAASVLANLWAIEDGATVEFSTAFHEAVKEGLAPGAALQRVQASFASRHKPTRSWAGWVIVGGYH
jgi:CHAT domain-containing protein